MVKTPEQKRLVQATFLLSRYGRPYSLPPGVPQERIQIMRDAFDKTMKDPQFLSDAKKLGRPVIPTSGANLQKLWKSSLGASPEEVAIVKEIFGKK